MLEPTLKKLQNNLEITHKKIRVFGGWDLGFADPYPIGAEGAFGEPSTYLELQSRHHHLQKKEFKKD